MSKRLLLVAMLVCFANAWGQSNKREPSIGYLYPSGGQQGRVFEIMAGGQFLGGVTDVYVTGEGVHASVIQFYRPLKNLDREQRLALHKRLYELWDKRWSESPRKRRAPTPPIRGIPRKLPRKARSTGKAPATEKVAATEMEAVAAPEMEAVAAPEMEAVAAPEMEAVAATEMEVEPLPSHPLLRNLEDLSLKGLQNVVNELTSFRKRQPNRQIAETVLIEVTIDPGAEPGDRELRIATRAGLTNPMCFQVGLLPETLEQEPNDPEPFALLPEDPPVDLPILLNGQIKPGDVDRFRFRAQRGQRLVMAAHARRLIPYLADAVPGWFQATLALYDATGKEVAFADDYRFDPDPVIFFEVLEDGEYELEVRDSIYRGRDDFVYRIAVGELPFITRMFPLGGRTGVRSEASIAGWNLDKTVLPLDTGPGNSGIRWTASRSGEWLSNEVPYAVDALPECDETEPNNSTEAAQRVGLPLTINGRIARPGDVDVFQFEGHAGDEVVAEVYGRRLHSPLDSLLRLTDASGSVLEWNGDHDDKAMGLCTHHADSYLRAQLPEDGVYCVDLADSQRHGGEAYAYRLRIAPPRPDFALRVTPSSASMPAGGAAPIRVHALRKEGFDGEIEIALKDAPPGFELNGGHIPAGRDCVRMTLTAPLKPLDRLAVLQLEGRATIGGQAVSRPAVPAEDMMQAFLYRHLAPSRELMVAVKGPRRGRRPVEIAGSEPVRIPAGGSAEVRLRTPGRPKLRDLQLELSEPPEGVTLHDVNLEPGGVTFLLKADADVAEAGFEDNLIVDVFARAGAAKQRGKGAKQKRRVHLGVLPAIPFEIVRQ